MTDEPDLKKTSPVKKKKREWDLIVMPILGVIAIPLGILSAVNLTTAWNEFNANLPEDKRYGVNKETAEESDGGFSIEINLPW